MTQTDTTSPVEQQKLREAKKATAAAAFGTFLEYYDFSVYGYCAARISKEFFPSDNPTVSLLSTLAVFGLAFIVRPLGGLFFGHIGDRYGRKFSLVATVVLIGVACTAIGCLPTYDQIGIAAPIMLILCRILQGFSAGGEIGSAAPCIFPLCPAWPVWARPGPLALPGWPPICLLAKAPAGPGAYPS